MIFNYKNLKIYYERKGSCDEAVLFLHGWEGSTHSFKFFFEKLSDCFSCINLDFPPFGKSSNLIFPLNLVDYFEIVNNLLEKEKIKKVSIIAHSFGGRVAIMLAARTQKVKKMILTGCAGVKQKSFKRFLKVKSFKFLKFLSKIHLFPYSKLRTFGSEDYKRLNAVGKQTFVNIVSFDQKKMLRQIDVPTLLIWGSKDKETPFYFTKIFKKHIKDCEVITFENCSHFAYLERPKRFLLIAQSFFSH